MRHSCCTCNACFLGWSFSPFHFGFSDWYFSNDVILFYSEWGRTCWPSGTCRCPGNWRNRCECSPSLQHRSYSLAAAFGSVTKSKCFLFQGERGADGEVGLPVTIDFNKERVNCFGCAYFSPHIIVFFHCRDLMEIPVNPDLQDYLESLETMWVCNIFSIPVFYFCCIYSGHHLIASLVCGWNYAMWSTHFIDSPIRLLQRPMKLEIKQQMFEKHEKMWGIH